MEYIMATQAENDVLKPILDKIEGFSEMPLTEKEFLNTLILRHKPKKILELGVSAGGSAAIILNAIKDDDEAFLYSVDYNTQWYKDTSFESGFIVKEKLPNLINKWKLFTPGLVANHIEQIGGDIDFCLIDTVHSNPGEILDFLMVLPYLKKDAIVVFHDISLQMWQETWASGMYTNCMLMSSIIGDKFLPSSSEHDTINIGAIQLNDYSTENAFDIFNLLFIPWAYQINDRDHIVLITHFRKFYSTDLIEFYKKARTFYNKRLEILPIIIATHQENSNQSVKIIPLITKIKTDEGKKIKLFGKITIFKVRKSPNKTSKYLFGIKYYEKKVS